MEREEARDRTRAVTTMLNEEEVEKIEGVARTCGEQRNRGSPSPVDRETTPPSARCILLERLSLAMHTTSLLDECESLLDPEEASPERARFAQLPRDASASHLSSLS